MPSGAAQLNSRPWCARIAAVSMAAVMLGGCVGRVGDQRDSGASPTDAYVAPPIDGGPNPAICRVMADSTRRTLAARCVNCHGIDGSGPAITTDILDVDALVTSGLVVAGNPMQSPLYYRLAEGTMPPPGWVPPTAYQIAQIGEWIRCGAPDW